MSKRGSKTNASVKIEDEDDSTKPDFIYGGPFVKIEKPSPLLNIATPINIQLQGTFKRSFAYYSLKERLPIILTKVIDYLSREGSKIKSTHHASDSDIVEYIQYITKLKNDLVTNKKYDLLRVDTPEAKQWNAWISAAENQHYFTNTWVFSECYVYRRLREGCELNKGLKNFDPFDEQKDKSFTQCLEAMCVVAERLLTMLPQSDKDKRKADFIALLKICLWSNKCDLSLSNGEQVSMNGGNSEGGVAPIVDPFQIIVDLKDMVLADDSSKISDTVISKAENMAKAIDGNTVKPKCSCNRLAAQTGRPVCEAPPAPDKPESPKEEKQTEGDQEQQVPPCPAKMTLPPTVIFDIVCDNAGYELFSDLCLAHFLVAQGIVRKVRFHVKKFAWFVSDVTPRDFKHVISSCGNASYSREIPLGQKEDAPEDAKPERRVIKSDALRAVGEVWAKYVENGTFVLMSDDFWTSPHVYKDMKKYDPALYWKLQFPVAVLFKGDLNYRKLVGEMNWNPTTSFETALQGFMPAPVIALRTVKADLICGLPKGKAEQLSAKDEKWMEKGDYGVIQFCAKSEPLKPSGGPCEFYGDECKGVVCPNS